MEDRGHMAGKAPPPLPQSGGRGELCLPRKRMEEEWSVERTLQAHRRDVREVIVHADWTYCRAARNRLFSR